MFLVVGDYSFRGDFFDGRLADIYQLHILSIEGGKVIRIDTKPAAKGRVVGGEQFGCFGIIDNGLYLVPNKLSSGFVGILVLYEVSKSGSETEASSYPSCLVCGFPFFFADCNG